MKIAIVSDLHLDFQNINKYAFLNEENAEILLIAGDTCESKNLDKFKNTFKNICDKYKDVFIIAGNHEFYKNFHADSLDQLYEFSRKFNNMHFLNNDCINLSENYILIGSTLWTDFNKGNPLVMNTAKDIMNDYKLIKIIKNGYRKLAPRDTFEFHIRSKEFIESELNNNKNKKVILFTHHAPSFLSLQNNSKPSYDDYCFASDLSNLILDNSHIKYWIHGHTHFSANYTIGNCNVISNPRGYPHENYVDNFKPLVIEIS